jgi:hypothetical protein
MKNELVCSLAAKATDHILVQRFKYGVLYINGEYSGIYALEEKTNEQMFADTYGVSRESVTVHEASVGEHTEFYQNVIQPILTRDMQVEENYQAVSRLLDMDSLIDWSILEGCFGNYDLGEGNLRYARNAANGGKWQLVLYDLDCAFLSPEYCMHNVLTYGNQVSTLNAKLMQSAEYRERFLSRAAEAWKDILSRENICRKIDELSAIIAPEVERDSALSGINEMQWREHLSQLKNKLSNGWTKNCVDTLCNICQVTPEEYIRYFGDLPDLK